MKKQSHNVAFVSGRASRPLQAVKKGRLTASFSGELCLLACGSPGGKACKESLAMQGPECRKTLIGRHRPEAALCWFTEKVPLHKA